jgi:uncharacterized Zn finger protein (UPF0148 family)
MIRYMCGKCKFSFRRIGEVDSCPKCGSMSVSFVGEENPERHDRLYEIVCAHRGMTDSRRVI